MTDPAVLLVEAYLQINGYFTVVEYPVLEASRKEGHRTATDLDVLAFRFPGAGRRAERKGRSGFGPAQFAVDPALGCSEDQADMIVGEVKQGRTRINPAMRDPLVLATALARFGCCPPGDGADRTVQQLLRKGRARAHGGHTIRLVAFGSSGVVPHAHTVTLGHVVTFVDSFLHRHWASVGRAQLSQPALAMLAVLRKAGLSPTSVLHEPP